MKEKSVTVLVTVKNSAHTIKDCMDSILKLNYRNLKVYVIDAFSTDGTYEILKSYGKRIKVEQLKGNPPKAYNHAIKRIDTKFIAMTDSDCKVEKNWLKNLIGSFESDEIGAVVGFCKTPKEVNFLQKLIGIELESRFKRFKKYIERGPTMNICIRTSLAKKLKFDEDLDVTYDADFGYRLSKLGKKIVYQPKALVYHYHRSNWKSFFKQQLIYGKFVPLLSIKHIRRAGGDHISKPLMMVQPLILYLSVLLVLLSIIYRHLIWTGILVFLSLFLVYFMDFLTIGTKKHYLAYYIPIFFVRTIAWCIGFIFSIKLVLKYFLKRRIKR